MVFCDVFWLFTDLSSTTCNSCFHGEYAFQTSSISGKDQPVCGKLLEKLSEESTNNHLTAYYGGMGDRLSLLDVVCATLLDAKLEDVVRIAGVFPTSQIFPVVTIVTTFFSCKQLGNVQAYSLTRS